MTKLAIKQSISDFKQLLMERFGSVARGDFKPLSDIDILVLLPFDTDNSVEEEVFGLAYDIELKYGVVFGIVVYSRSFWNSPVAQYMPLHKNIEREGVVL